MSTNLVRLEADDATVGGFLITFPSGCKKSVHWQTESLILPAITAAKDYAARVVDTLLREGRQDDIDRTNWASVTAAIQRIVMDFNDIAGKRIHAAAGH